MVKEDLYLRGPKELNPDHPTHSSILKMDYQSAQQYANQNTVQNVELNPLFHRDFLHQEAQNVFSYVPGHQISQMFPDPSYESVLMENALEGYTWPAQGSEINHAATDPGDPLQVQPCAQLQSAVADHATDEVGPSFEDRFTLLEGKIGGLEVIIQDLRNE